MMWPFRRHREPELTVVIDAAEVEALRALLAGKHRPPDVRDLLGLGGMTEPRPTAPTRRSIFEQVGRPDPASMPMPPRDR
jgi:hypothetical protein